MVRSICVLAFLSVLIIQDMGGRKGMKSTEALSV